MRAAGRRPIVLENVQIFNISVVFLDSCDGETKLKHFMKIWQMHEHGGDELLLILGRF